MNKVIVVLLLLSGVSLNLFSAQHEKDKIAEEFTASARNKDFTTFNRLCLENFTFAQKELKEMKQKLNSLEHWCEGPKPWRECPGCVLEPSVRYTIDCLQKGIRKAEKQRYTFKHR